MIKNSVLPAFLLASMSASVGLAQQPAANTSLPTAHPGDLLQLPQLDSDHLPILDATVTPEKDSPQYLLSDNPETFPKDSIALRETVQPGPVRLYLYHSPERAATTKKVVSATIENLSDRPLTLRFTKYTLQPPDQDYYKVGKAGLIDYFTAAPPADAPRTIPPHGRAILDPALERYPLVKDDLIHGFYEFTVDEPARIAVLQRSPDADTLKSLDTLPVAPSGHGGAGRGLYPISNFAVSASYDTTAGPARIVIADGKRDPWIKGTDALSDNAEVRNAGNYGVIYHLTIRYKSSDGRGLTLLMCKPINDHPYCRHTAAAVVVSDGVDKGGVVPLPRAQTTFGNPPDAVVIQRFAPPAAGQEGTIELTYSPPGASCLPTPLLLVPYKP
jgi:hypothetical protein